MAETTLPQVAVKQPPQQAGVADRIARLLQRAPLHVAVVLIAIVWMVPALGLLVSSFREPAAVFWTFCCAWAVAAWKLVSFATGMGNSGWWFPAPHGKISCGSRLMRSAIAAPRACR